MPVGGVFAALRPQITSKTPQVGWRCFHASRPDRASVLFALASLSNSRETQHFNKLSKLNRIEHSPSLKLIKTSEVDPFPLPTPPKRSPDLSTRHVGGMMSAARVWDERALKVGRVFLSDQARQNIRMMKALQKSKRRQLDQETTMKRDRLAWAQESRRLRSEVRKAGVLILLSIGAATALATWRFWPQHDIVDSAILGNKLAERASLAMPLPAISKPIEVGGPSPVAALPVVEPVVAKPPVLAQPESAMEHPGTNWRWWKGFFWKQG